MKIPIILAFILLLFGSASYGQPYTPIPDPNFEQALIDLEVDSDGTINGEVLTEDIKEITSLNVFNKNIQSLQGIEDFDSLRTLNCANNRLTVLDISNNTKLSELNCASNSLSILDVSANTSLESINCQGNLIDSLDVSANELLRILDFTSNDISSIDLLQNDSLTTLKCSDNKLSELVLTNNPRLNELSCSSNRLEELILTNNSELTTLSCASNRLTTLDLTVNDTLISVDCSDNQLTTLNVGPSRYLERLTCSANQLTSLDISENDSLLSLACSNNQLKTLDVSANTLLTSLICASNQLNDLDVSANTALTNLNFSHNLIKSQDLSPIDSLTSLNCSNNLLRYLNISNDNNIALTDFNAKDNPLLTCIVVDDINEIGEDWEKDNIATYSTTCTPIQTLVPDDNFEQALIDLGLDTGPLDNLVVTDSINSLTTLDISGENISDLTGIEDFIALNTLNCSNNQITSLDLTKNTVLTDLDCSDNNLTNLNLKNNNNGSLTNMDARVNQASLCIAIDNGFTPTGGWQKDGSASYVANCNAGETFIPDDNFEQALIDHGIDAGTLDNYVATASISGLTSLDVSNKYIADLTGIEDFTSLDTLDCSSNILTDLDISNNTNLQKLSCFGNYLTNLDVASNTALLSLHCGDNLLSALNVDQNTNLEELIFDGNNITQLDTISNINLRVLSCNSNKLTSAGFVLTEMPNLERLFCARNKLSSLNISQNTSLIKLDCSGNSLDTLDLSANVDIEKVDCSRNFLSDLPLDDNAELDTLICGSNQLSSLILDSNPLLRMLSCDDNLLSGIEVASNDSLRFLSISGNDISELDVTNNEELIHLNCNDNQLDELVVTSNTELSFLSCSNNNLDSLNIAQNTNLLSLSADDNQLPGLNTNTNTALVKLSVANNRIDSLDVDANANLEELNCSGNNLVKLNLNLLTKLTSVSCSSNELTELSVQNGENDSLSTFNARSNSDLFCIEIDDPDNIGEDWQKDESASYSANCHYNETYIPDDNFESAVAAITGEPDNNDDYILTSSISNLTALDVSNEGISDLTGIQDFTSLQTLDVSNNSIDSIYLNDIVDLVSFNGSSNQFDALGLSENKLLEDLDVSDNLLTYVNLDSLILLSSFACDNNQIIDLDLTIHSELTALTCTSNQLEYLSVNNGNNDNLTTFDATNNTNLTCIQIDDVDNIGSTWLKDAIASYSENCHYNETYVPDDAFEQILIDFGYDYSSNGPLDDYIPTAKIDQVTILRIRNMEIADLTGIEDFDALTQLDCSSNELTKLDISNNANLVFLNCSGNQLNQLNTSFNPQLANLNISNNQFAFMDISQNDELITFNFSSNQLTSLDIVQNTKLREVIGQKNQLVSVEANNGFNNTLEVFDLRNNPSLTCILVDDISAANSYPNWFKDQQAQYKLECNDDDNDGIADANDNCPTTPFGDQVDLFGCSIFSLPADNFTILTTAESCRTGNNGKINITAKAIHPYVATLTGSVDTVDYEFFDKVEIRNVHADTYELCISIIGKPDYQQCFTLQVTEPESIKAFRVGDNTNGRIGYALAGSAEYIVEFNGSVFETEEDYIDLTLEQGKNTIKIKTGLDCQGVFEDVIYFSDKVSIFPNPFKNTLSILTADDLSDEVWVNVYTPSGKLMDSRKYNIVNGKADVDGSSLASGMYIIEVSGESYRSTFKVAKQ